MEVREQSSKKKRLVSIAMVLVCILSGIVFWQVSGTVFGRVGVSERHEIIPSPLTYKIERGDFVLTNETVFFVKGNNKEETQELYQIANRVRQKWQRATGFKLEIKEGDQVPKGSIVLTTRGGLESQGDEGYTLEVRPDQVQLRAYKPEGIARGIQTVRQLLPPESESIQLVNTVEWQVTGCTIEDRPVYAYRGLMIDVARHFVPVEELKRQIDLAAYYKINKVHLHLTDDQGWRLEIKKWPELTSVGGKTAVDGGKGGYYTQEQFKEIVQYAKERYIEIIPEIDMPGHTNAALASYGFLNPDGKKKEAYTGIEVGFSTLMCRDEKTYDWVEDVLREVAAISPSAYIHIGGDESHSTPKDDYDYFIGRVVDIVKKYDKIPIGWEPCDTVTNVQSEVVVQKWLDEKKLDKNGVEQVIVAPAGKAYLDMKYDEQTPYGLKWAGYNSIKDAYQWDPTEYATKEHILGVEAPLWTEKVEGQKQIDYMIYPRLLGHSEIGWTPKARRQWGNYKKRLMAHEQRMKIQGIGYYEEN